MKDAPAWALVVAIIGVLATFAVALVASVMRQIQALGEGLRGEMKAGFEAVGYRFDAVNSRFDAVDRRLDGLDGDVQALTDKVFRRD